MISPSVAMADTRDRILVATNELFRRQGYNGTSLSQISEAANATIGSIYHFFPGGKEALAVAVQQKDLLESEKANLVAQLTQTRTVLAQTEEALDDQIDLTEEVHEDWIDQHFERFVNAAQLEICERGNRKKLGACRETVTGLLRRDKVVVAFEHCLRSGQEAPMVVNHDIDGPLPMFASYLDQRDKVVRDWAVQSCDPTLPEAPALLASSAQRLGIL